MEVKPGYKQTEVGVIPEDWEVSCVGNSFRRVQSTPFADKPVSSRTHSRRLSVLRPNECARLDQ